MRTIKRHITKAWHTECRALDVFCDKIGEDGDRESITYGDIITTVLWMTVLVGFIGILNSYAQ